MWQLTVSVDKCCVLSDVPRTIILLDGTALPYITSCQDPGFTVTSDLLPSIYVNNNYNIVAKAHQCTNAIQRCFTSKNTVLSMGLSNIYLTAFGV